MGNVWSAAWRLECVGELEQVSGGGMRWSETPETNLYQPSP